VNVFDILKDRTTKWNRKAPASPGSIDRLVVESKVELPGEYLTLLRYSNGGEGELGVKPGWFQLWPAEEVVALNESYEVEQNVPGFFGIGSNGGGELLAFDTRGGKPWKVVMIPFIPMTAEEAIVIVKDFGVFIQAMGHEYEDG
jgi:hypothetical protein